MEKGKERKRERESHCEQGIGLSTHACNEKRSSGSGNLFIVVAPSGAGKSTLINALLAQDDAICLSISYTTRPPRAAEVNGREYYFLTVEEFLARRAQGEFLESAEVHGNYYASSRLWIEQQLEKGHDVLLEIDWQGARQVRKQFQQAIGIFILPPSLAALEMRLKKRAQDEPEVIARRLLAAKGEIAHAPEFDYIVINQTFADALSELQCIIHAARLRFTMRRARQAQLFAEFGID